MDATSPAAEAVPSYHDTLFVSSIWGGRESDTGNLPKPHRLSEHPVHCRNLFPLFPSNVEWTRFPFFSDARYKPILGKLDPLSPLGQRGVVDRFSNQEFFPFVEESSVSPTYRRIRINEMRALAAAFRNSVAPDSRIVVRSAADDRFREMDELEMLGPAGGTLHFDYNYKFNARAILQPLISSLATAPDMAALPIDWEKRRVHVELRRRLYEQHGNLPLARSVMAIQYLFLIGDLDFEASKHLYQIFAGKMFRRAEMSLGSHLREGLWLGSGKYAPFDVRQDFSNCLDGLFSLGFMNIDHRNETAFLSPHGRKLVQSLHKANRDPDILSRFYTAGTIDIRYDKRERIDDCLGRFFRKLKTKVQA